MYGCVMILLMEEAPTVEQPKSYGKRPLWQWVVLYLIIGAIVYGLIYYLVFAKKGGYNYNQTAQTPTQPQPTKAAVTEAMTLTSPVKVNLAAENSSGESGTAMLKEESGQVLVTLSLTGFPN